MMKKYWYILMMTCCCLLVFSSCGKDDDNVIDEEWKQQNEDAFDAISMNPAYSELKSLGNNGSIYYKVLKEGEGTKQIYYNSIVKIYYSGWMIDGTLFDQKEYPYQSPSQLSVNGFVEGVTTALQYMHVGDRWEIWVPYQLGYGTGGNYDGTIPGYSTLKFEMEVVEIVTE